MIGKLAYLRYRNLELKRFEAGAARARDVQHDVLFAKLRRNANSDFGRAHGFADIRSLADFRKRVPVSDYEYYRPYVDRVYRGEINAMFGPGTKVLMLAMTSGTTNKPKHIPITQEFFDEYRKGWHLWALGTFRDHVDLMQKKYVKLASNWRQSLSDGGIPCGNISGLVIETAPWFFSRRFVVPRPVMRIDDPVSKHYTALRLSVACPGVGMIGTANPSTMIEFARLADRRRDSLIRDIRDGALTDDVDVPQDVRHDLRRHIRRQPRRARELEQVVERTGHLYPKDFWPVLSVVPVWLGGSVSVYLSGLKKYWGAPALRDHGLSASEGRMTIPLRDGTSAGIIEYINHFFEFIPEEEHDSADPTVLEAHELEEGRNYYILLTTSAGMYRYDIHDVVRCVAFEGQAPILTFLNKGAHFSSITGEKISEFQVVSAVKAGFQDLGLATDHFTLAPVMNGERPAYVLLLEPAAHHGRADVLAQRVESHLCEQNWEYAEKRRTGRIEPLTVKDVPQGTWNALRARKTAGRGNLEEYKHPCLVGKLDFVTELLDEERG